MSNNIKKEENHILSITRSEDNAQSVNKNIREIVDFFTEGSNTKASLMRRLIGKNNIDYMLLMLQRNKDKIKDSESARELKNLLLNPTVLFLYSHDEIYSFLKKYPILENCKYIQRCIIGRLKNMRDKDICIICCKELETLFTKFKYYHIPEIEAMRANFKILMYNYTSSYNSLEDGSNHEGDICKGVLFQLFQTNYIGASRTFNDNDKTEDIFIAFIDTLMEKLPILSKNHLIIFSSVLSDSSFMYRANGLEDSYKILEILSGIEKLDDYTADLIISFFENVRSINRQCNPDYDMFIAFLELASILDYGELQCVYEKIFDDIHLTPSLTDIRQLLFNVVEREFPAIYNLEIIIRSSMLECRDSNLSYIDDFLNVLYRKIKNHCESLDANNLTIFKARVALEINEFYYKEQMYYLKTLLENTKKLSLSKN